MPITENNKIHLLEGNTLGLDVQVCDSLKFFQSRNTPVNKTAKEHNKTAKNQLI